MDMQKAVEEFGRDKLELIRHILAKADRGVLDAALEQEREIERLRAALAELVALKDIKESGGGADYDRRKPLAWQAARGALRLGGQS